MRPPSTAMFRSFQSSPCRLRLLVVPVALALITSCGAREQQQQSPRAKSGAAAGSSTPAPIAPAESSAPAGLVTVAEGVLAALIADDHAALVSLRVNFERYAEPALQDALSNVAAQEIPVEVLWANMNGRSTEAELVLLKRYAEQQLALVGVEFDRVEERGVYRLYRGVRLLVRDANGAETSIQAIGGVLEDPGQEQMAVLFYDTKPAPAPVPRIK